MNRSLALALTLASGLSLSAFAQSPAAPAGSAKVAVIAFQAAVAQTNEFQRNYADLEKKYEPKRQQLKSLNDEIDGLTKQLQSQASTLSDAQRTTRAQAIDSKKKELQRDAEDAQNDFQQDLQQMFSSVAQKVGAVMTDYAKKEGYSVVLDASQQENPVLYAAETVNITKPVLEAYNQKSGIPAPPAAPAAPHASTGAAHTTHPATHSTAH